eukprot:923113-Alexandrium_andersonii.AAC.1
MVCRGRLGNPTLGPLEETVRAGDLGEAGRRAPMLYADWTSGFPERRGDAPRIALCGRRVRLDAVIRRESAPSCRDLERLLDAGLRRQRRGPYASRSRE